MNELYAYKTTFTIVSQESLDDFWSFVIFRLRLEHSEHVYDRFARLYNLLSECKNSLTTLNKVNISLEESSDIYFMSIDSNIKDFIDTFISRLEKLQFTYAYENGVLKYSVNKKKQSNIFIQDNSSNAKIYTYSFMDDETIEEMLDILEKMKAKDYEKVYPTITLEEINDYRTTFSYYGSFLRDYSQLSAVHNIVTELSVILSLYSNECLAMGNDFRLLLGSFLNNLSNWQDSIFIKKEETLDFMDASLKADLEQIKIILNLYDDFSDDANQTSLDDIFGF